MATFKRLTPTPAIDGGTTPISRSSHGVSALLNDALNKTRIVIYGGEHVARTPIADSTQSLWVAESTTNSISDVDGGQWKWINPKQGMLMCESIKLIYAIPFLSYHSKTHASYIYTTYIKHAQYIIDQMIKCVLLMVPASYLLGG